VARHGFIQGQRIRRALKDQQTAQALGTFRCFATRTPKCSSPNVIALIASSPSSAPFQRQPGLLIRRRKNHPRMNPDALRRDTDNLIDPPR
jgi:hypothetical protein